MNFATASGGSAVRGLADSRSPAGRSSADHVPQWVAMAAVYTTQARTPCGLTSTPSACVKPASANFEAQYADALAQPRLPATDETFTIVPWPASTNVWNQQPAEHEHGAQIDRHHAIPRVHTQLRHRPGTSVPAALTSTRTGPSSRRTRSTALSRLPTSARSHATGSASPPSRANVSATPAKSDPLRASRATPAPARPSVSAAARPKPLLAPVTSATCPISAAVPFIVPPQVGDALRQHMILRDRGPRRAEYRSRSRLASPAEPATRPREQAAPPHQP